MGTQAECSADEQSRDELSRSDLASSDEQRRHFVRNYLLGIGNAVFGETSRDFIQPQLVLGGFVALLAGDVRAALYLVPLLTVAEKAGALGPQLLIGSRFEHLTRKKPAYIIVTIGRGLTQGALWVSMILLVQGTGPLQWTFFYVSFFLRSMFGGAAFTLFVDLAGRMIPREKVGGFLGARSFLGGVAAFLAAFFIVQPIVDGGDGEDFIVLALVAAVLSVLSMMFFWFCHEGKGESARRRTSMGESLRRGWVWLKEDRNYRAYFWMRVAFRVNYVFLAFFIPFGKERLSGTTDVVLLGGILAGSFKLSRVVMSAVWGHVADRWGYRACMLGAGAGFFAAPLVALVAPHLPQAFVWNVPWTEVALDLPIVIGVLALAVFGAAIQGSVIGGHRFVITMAPRDRRPSYAGFLNTVTSPLTLLPLAGAWLADQFGLVLLFVLVLAGGVAYLYAARRIAPDRNTRRAIAERNGEAAAAEGD